MDEEPGYFRSLFAAVLLAIAGGLNVIYGIAAIGGSDFFDHNAHYLFGNLTAWGWATLAIGVLELAATVSLVAGHRFGAYIGVAVGFLAALEALLAIPAAPFWSLAVFALSLWIIHGLALYSAAPHKRKVSVGPAHMQPLGPRAPM